MSFFPTAAYLEFYKFSIGNINELSSNTSFEKKISPLPPNKNVK